MVKLLIERFAARVDARRRDGSTALMDACEAGKLATARRLCDERRAARNMIPRRAWPSEVSGIRRRAEAETSFFERNRSSGGIDITQVRRRPERRR